MANTDTDPGIRRTDLYNIRFYEKMPFYGSFRGMHYRIKGEDDADGTRQLCVTTWPGPYNFDHTDDAKKVSACFDFSDKGLDAVTDYLNRYYAEHFA
ncbi:MAG: GNAT family acetyltransferase [Lachnospiraceae bacterium]|nr:GNAT family acetyltransferase [Lachnospiraceae bacterium]